MTNLTELPCKDERVYRGEELYFVTCGGLWVEDNENQSTVKKKTLDLKTHRISFLVTLPLVDFTYHL